VKNGTIGMNISLPLYQSFFIKRNRYQYNLFDILAFNSSLISSKID